MGDIKNKVNFTKSNRLSMTTTTTTNNMEATSYKDVNLEI